MLLEKLWPRDFTFHPVIVLLNVAIFWKGELSDGIHHCMGRGDFRGR